jgi:hypothetical protein
MKGRGNGENKQRTVARLLNSRLKEGTYPKDSSSLSSSSFSRREVPCSQSVIVDVARVRRKRRVAALERREEHRTNLSSAVDSNLMRSGYHRMDKQKSQLTPVSRARQQSHARCKSITLIGHVDVRVAQDGRRTECVRFKILVLGEGHSKR